MTNHNSSLIVVLPFHGGDLLLAEKLLAWICELAAYRDHYLLLATDGGVDRSRIVAMVESAKPRFDAVWGININVPPQRQAWIAGSDFMFLQTAKYIYERTKCPFLWLEPDCIPLAQGWLKQLAAAYECTPMRFLGTIVRQTDQPELPREHMTGCGLYPQDAFLLFNQLQTVVNGTQAFDIAAASQIVPAAKDSPLMQSYWGMKDLWPVFVEARTEQSPKNHLPLSFLKKETVLFHRDKEHSLIPLLRKRLFGSRSRKTAAVVEVTPPEPAAADA